MHDLADKVKIKETEVTVPLSNASRARYNEKGYNFPKEYITQKVKVKVKVSDLQPKSNAMITRICVECGKEDYMTYHKAKLTPRCHKCICNTDEFRKNVGIAAQKARKLRGSKSSARRQYLLEVADIPKGYVIHHINMNDQDNRIENYIALNNSQHLITHGTFNRLCEELMNLGIVRFNKETLKYELN